MDDDNESEEVERANVVLREEMLRYNVITDTDDKYPVMQKLAKSKMLVPVHEDEADPDALPSYGTLYGDDKGKQLFVYTSVLLIPADCPAQGVSFIPFLELVVHLYDQGDIKAIRIDPGTNHGVGILFEKDGPVLFRLKRVEDYLAEKGDYF